MKSSSHKMSASDFWRIVPMMLGALMVMLFSVDALLAYQPAILKDLTGSWQSLVSMQPMLAPSANVLAATIASATVVIASTALLAFARASAGAAHLVLTPPWVAFCMLVVSAIRVPLPLPMPVFAALCGVLFVGAGAILRQGSSIGTITGWCLIALPFVLVTDSYVRAPSTGSLFGGEAGELLLWLGLSAVGVVLIAYARPRRSKSDQVDGLDGVDVVETLFEQIERAERSEARVAELERQLNNAYGRRRAS
jgi:hypothetical protein